MTDKKRLTIAPTDAILESISDGVFTVDGNWRITSFNRAAEEITGIKRKDAIGQLCSEVFRSSLCEGACALRQTLESGKSLINRPCFIVNAAGQRVPVSISTAVLRDSYNNTIGGAETFRDLSEVEALRQELAGRIRIGDLVSRSLLMRKIFDLAPTVAQSDSTVLINGETGTGKELLAKAIHSLSRRENKPFIAINCGALPDTLLESELFGYKKGAFTGAERDKPGRFALAEGGTLFLDEIGEISPALQVRLLRVLQERVYEPLGASKSTVADVRIIAATNRNLTQMVKTGKFREDLFYRINVIRFELPPLRKRKDDIPLLIEHFIERFNRIQHKNIQGIAAGALELLMAHDWPGNVRELENVIERAFVICGSGSLLVAHLPEELTGLKNQSPCSGPIVSAVRSTERQSIIAALQKHQYNCSAAAAELGIHRSTFYRKANALDIDLRGVRRASGRNK
ncbi:MAG: sigma 54-interacting transcriptional regulator [Victivallaceae bacterium]|nr:sigma 54-interacting transcriptional regulator [Victivallaceae bacterium]MDD3704119.1 sigma 54-interacting transcriptional regulator [Victivallaceae bacterium]